MRAKFLSSLALALGMALAPVQSALSQQQYPHAPVRILCGFSAGGSTDSAARLAAKWLQDELKQSFYVDNRVGANGVVAIQALKSSKPDGYTLMMVTGGLMTMTPAVKTDVVYNPLEDFTPIAIVGWYPYAVVARPGFPANDVPGLIDYAKKNPGKLTYGSAGIGSTNHLGTEWFDHLAGISMNHVPYKGDAPGISDLLADRLDVYFMTPSVVMPHVKMGKVKLLGSTGNGPSPLIEGEKRMVSSTVPGYELGSWLALVGPAGMARADVEKLNKILNNAMQKPEMKAQMASAGLVPILVTPDAFRHRIQAELTQWQAVARSANIRISD
ncbi:MAG: tripartite tricarboxylate transporter substrate binding protein [Pseudomonadota bacterium]